MSDLAVTLNLTFRSSKSNQFMYTINCIGRGIYHQPKFAEIPSFAMVCIVLTGRTPGWTHARKHACMHSLTADASVSLLFHAYTYAVQRSTEILAIGEWLHARPITMRDSGSGDTSNPHGTGKFRF